MCPKYDRHKSSFPSVQLMSSAFPSDTDPERTAQARRGPDWRAFLIRFLTGLVIAFFGSVFGGIAWLVFQSTADPTSPKNRITIAAALALVGAYLLFLGLKKMVRRERSQTPEPCEADQIRWFNTVSILIIVALAAIANPFTRGLLGPLYSAVVYGFALYFGAVAMIVVHELGHCLGAWAFGQQVGGVCVGDGRVIYSGNKAGVEVTWRVLPITGHVAVQESRNWSRAGIISFAAAGPIATLLFGAVILMLSPEQVSALFPEPWAQTCMNIRRLMLQMVVCSSVLSLLPFNVPFGSSRVPSDGCIILNALFPLRGR